MAKETRERCSVSRANGGAEALGGFALGLADRNRQPTRLTIAVRPSVKFLGATFKKAD